MSNENKTIHDFELNLICDFFSTMKRQGPGSPEVTLKALSFIDNLTDKSLIADLGCGTGGQTMVLAEHAPGKITGLDFLPGFVDIFNRNARQTALQDRVKGIVGSMDNLPFQEGELDLIWSEGAIYNIGFERGLNEWRKYLKPSRSVEDRAAFFKGAHHHPQKGIDHHKTDRKHYGVVGNAENPFFCAHVVIPPSYS